MRRKGLRCAGATAGVLFNGAQMLHHQPNRGAGVAFYQPFMRASMTRSQERAYWNARRNVPHTLPTSQHERQPMGHLSTHVLDTMHGCAAAGMQVTLQRVQGQHATTLKAFTLNADGRHDGGALLDAPAMAVGLYRLVFAVAPYFRARGVTLPQPAFIDQVLLDFGIADAAAHYHVPLLVSPWAYSAYRGS